MRLFAALPALVLLASSAGAVERPRVVKLDPPDLWGDVDAKTTGKLTVTFDQPMSTSGSSWCVGGPSFPPSSRRLETRCGRSSRRESRRARLLVQNFPVFSIEPRSGH